MLQRKTVAPATLALLKQIANIHELSDFYLAGGTSLSLQIGHRISLDLDFFGKREFTTDQIISLLQPISAIKIVSQNKNILILNANGIKVDFVNYPYPLISEPINEEGIRLLGLPDIAAMKLAAVAGRGRKRDFYDLFFLLKEFSLRQLLDFYNKKYHDGSEMMVLKSLTFFEDAESDEEPILFDKKLLWINIKDQILCQVRNTIG